MCEALETIKFCSCEENLDLSKSEKDRHYIWILSRVREINTSGVMGLTLLPGFELDELIPEFIVEELNSKYLFDFEFDPQENDSLRIERIDRKKNQRDEYLFGNYLNFYFRKGEWHIGQTNPFMFHSEVHKNGHVTIKKVSDS